MAATFPNAEQKSVIDAVSDSLLVLAPMGTGKTRTAAAAIQRAIESGLKPECILGLAFTNRAAEAMRSAVAETLPEQSHKVQLLNLHGLCVRILREESTQVRLPHDFGILDEDEASELLWQYIPAMERQERYHNKPHEALNQYEKYVVRFLGNETQEPIPYFFRLYRDALYRDGVVDFTGLIARTHRLLQTHPLVLSRWQNRFQWVLVDEIQDINLPEYQIIARLAGSCRCLKFFGDPHQTIFEWRFAQPQLVLENFQKEFQPKKLALIVNYRCSQSLVDITNHIRREFIGGSDPLPRSAQQVSEGKISLREFPSPKEELVALTEQLQTWQQEGIPWSSIGVLARTNMTLAEISSTLKMAEIPHLAVEDFDFFRRREVKDVMAILELLTSPFRRTALCRLLKLFGAKTSSLESFEKEASGTGLHAGYLIGRFSGDPLQPLIQAWKSKSVVGFDTETTGLDPATAEIVQLARIEAGLTYQEYVRPSGRVGQSVHTHGLTDEFLASKGRDLKNVLQQGLHFQPSQILVGHNLAYDLWVLRYQMEKVGLNLPLPRYYDTMPLAAATMPREKLTGLRLSSVVQGLGLKLDHAHDAGADARASLAVLDTLMPTLIETQQKRLEILAHLTPDLALARGKVTQLMESVKDSMNLHSSVAEWIACIWKILMELPGGYTRGDKSREANIKDLAGIAEFLQTKNDKHLSLQSFLDHVALGRRDMLIEVDPNRVRLLTVHSAKGLEFDAVALPRLLAPWRGYSDEEARVFYVMITRAKKHLWMSWPSTLVSKHGYPQKTSSLAYLSPIKARLNP